MRIQRRPTRGTGIPAPALKRHLERLLFYLCIFYVALSGCVDVEVHTSIRENGSGVQRWRIVSSALMASEVKKQLQDSGFFASKGTKFSEQYVEGDYILQAEIEFNDVSRLQDRDHSVSLEKKGFLKRHFVYTETWKANPDAVSGPLKAGPTTVIPIVMKVSVFLPGKIASTNADRIENNIAYWNIRLHELGSPKTLRLETHRWNLWALFPVAGLAALAIAVVAVRIVRKKRGAHSTCPQCKSRLPENSSFCNKCGAQIIEPIQPVN